MNLNAYAAEKRLAFLEDLKKGQPPREGVYDEHLFKDGKVKGQPQMGTTRYEPSSIVFEFIYPDPHTTATVLSVRIPAPERIVFLPVPEWVVETIWQGDIDGSFHFESEAMALVSAFQGELGAAANEKWFGKREAKRRE